MAIECAGSLALSMMSHLLVGVTGNGTDYKHFHRRYVSSSLVRGVGAARELFALKVKRYSRAAEVSGSFMDLVEFEISRRYETVTGKHGQPLRLCDLNARSTYHLMNTPEILVQKLSNASSNDIEDAKFAIRALFYFRSICEVVEEVHDRLGSFLGPDSLNERWGDDAFEIRTVEVMEGEFVDFSGGAEKNRPQVGADLDVRGRTFFYFTPTMTGIKQPQSTSDHKRRLAADIIRMTKKTELIALRRASVFGRPGSGLQCSSSGAGTTGATGATGAPLTQPAGSIGQTSPGLVAAVGDELAPDWGRVVNGRERLPGITRQAVPPKSGQRVVRALGRFAGGNI